MKLIHTEEYKGYQIYISGKYIHDYYDFHEKETSAVRLCYDIADKKGNEVKLEEYQSSTVAKKNIFKFLFWEFKPKVSFEQQVKEELEDTLSFIKKKIDTKIYENEVTDGLLDSLNEIK